MTKMQSETRLNGTNVLKTEYKVKFQNSELLMLIHQKPKSKTIINNKWADFFFGLKFGAPTGDVHRRNGGWSRWNFLDITVQNKGKNILLTKNYPVKFISTYHDKTKNICLMSWDIPETNSRLDVIIAEIPNNPQSLFLKIYISNPKNITLSSVRFLCYPWETAGPKFRERWFKTMGKAASINKKSASFEPENNWLAFYNKFSQTNGTCFVFTDYKKIKKLEIPKSSYAVAGRYFPVSNVSSLSFALGVNNELPAMKAINLYQSKEKKIIKILNNKKLFTIKNNNEFRKMKKKIEYLLKRASFPTEEYKKSLKLILQKRRSAPTIYKKLETVYLLKEMKEELIVRLLKDF